ncbi:MAG TPA: hypothetical protein VFH24_05290 [Gemmatimonadales bacterium]|nr:hypothetical protein [Gemmatimonadales bacterium]
MRWFFLTVALGLGTAGPALAQANCLEQVKLPEVGRWAEYKATSQNDPYTIRYSVIGNEERGGKDFRWVEMQMTGTQKDKNMVYQMLVPGSFAELDQVQEVIFKPGNQPAMKISGQMLGMIRGQLNKQSFLKEVCKGVSLVGKESLSVPAGKFETLHFRSTEHGSDSWVSADVPFSMVKATGKQFQMELAAHGQGAKSSITEKPQEMGGMGARPN